MSFNFTEQEARAATEAMLRHAHDLPAHNLALTALLSAYATLGLHYRCCTPTCVMALRLAADQLESTLAPSNGHGSNLH